MIIDGSKVTFKVATCDGYTDDRTSGGELNDTKTVVTWTKIAPRNITFGGKDDTLTDAIVITDSAVVLGTEDQERFTKVAPDQVDAVQKAGIAKKAACQASASPSS